jgi:hypothetical protein
MLLRLVLGLVDRLLGIRRLYERELADTIRRGKLVRNGYNYKGNGRWEEAVPDWMVKKDEPRPAGTPGSGAGAGQKSSAAAPTCRSLRKRPGPSEIH